MSFTVIGQHALPGGCASSVFWIPNEALIEQFITLITVKCKKKKKWQEEAASHGRLSTTGVSVTGGVGRFHLVFFLFAHLSIHLFKWQINASLSGKFACGGNERPRRKKGDSEYVASLKNFFYWTNFSFLPGASLSTHPREAN